jgi:hypothetical protein
MSLVERFKQFLASAAKPGRLEQDWSDVVPVEVPVEVGRTEALELPSDGWVVVETNGEPSGYGVLRRGETLVRFHEVKWKGRDGLAVTRGPGVRVDVEGWVPGRDGHSPEPAALRIPLVDLPVLPELTMEQWLVCLQRHGLLVGVTAKQLVRSGIREGWLEDFWSEDGASDASMYSAVLVGLASDESRALKRHAGWLRSFLWFEDEAHAEEAVELAKWLGVQPPVGPAHARASTSDEEEGEERHRESFSALLLACNEAAQRAGVPARLFLLDNQEAFVAVKLTPQACADLVLNGAIEIIAPTRDYEIFQFRHMTLARLASMADETGHPDLASVLLVEAMELARRAARSDVHGPWGEDVKVIAAMHDTRGERNSGSA